MRLTQLDSVRAFAIGAVMVEHFGGATLNSYLPIGMGSIGVGCFFALSGYLITSSLLGDFDNAAPGARSKVWGNFYMRRFLRLLPAYYLWIGVLVLLGISPIPESWPWHVAYLSNVWIALGHPILDFWSLAVEEQFYLFWPFVIALTPRRWLGHTIFGITVLGVIAFKFVCAKAGVSATAIQTLLFSNMTELGLGALLALTCYRNGKAYDFSWYTGRVKTASHVVAAACLTTAIVCWYVYGKAGLYRYYFNDFICAVPFVWLIVNASIGFKGVVGAVFENSVLRYVGRISYGIYLTHNFMPHIVEKFLGPMPKYQAAPIVLIATFGVCIFSWHFIEKPILRLKRYFEPKRPAATAVDEREPAPVAAPAPSVLRGAEQAAG